MSRIWNISRYRDSATRFSTSGFLHGSVSPKPLIISLGPLRIFSKMRGDIRSSRCTTGVVDTGGKFATWVVDTGGAPWLANIFANFRKIRNDPSVIIRGLGEDDSWKKSEAKNFVTLSLQECKIVFNFHEDDLYERFNRLPRNLLPPTFTSNIAISSYDYTELC